MLSIVRSSPDLSFPGRVDDPPHRDEKGPATNKSDSSHRSSLRSLEGAEVLQGSKPIQWVSCLGSPPEGLSALSVFAVSVELSRTLCFCLMMRGRRW